MTWTCRTSAEDRGESTTPTLAWPAGIEDGDVVILGVGSRTASTIDTPQGFIPVTPLISNNGVWRGFMRFADGEETGNITAPLDASGRWTVVLSAYYFDSELDGVISIAASSTNVDDSAGTSHATDALWSPHGNEMAVAMFAHPTTGAGTHSWTAPSGFTERQEEFHSSGTSYSQMICDDLTIETVGAVGGFTATSNTSAIACNTLILLQFSRVESTLTNPTGGEALDDAADPVTWTYADATASPRVYRVRVYSGTSCDGTLVYDSGEVFAGEASHVIPYGQLQPGTTYAVQVESAVGDGRTSLSDCVTFTVTYAAAFDIPTVDVTVRGDCDQPEALPMVRLEWDQVVGAPTFLGYHVFRRADGGAYELVAEIENSAVVEFEDFEVESRVVYQYVVVWYGTDETGDVLVSGYQATPAFAWLRFDWNWIHVVGAEDLYLRYDAWDFSVQVRQSLAYAQVAGRTAPVAQVGDSEYRVISVQGAPHRLRRVEPWQTLRAIVSRQRTGGDVICVRLGRAREMLYCQIDAPQRSVSQKEYETRIGLTEVDYVRRVAVA